MKQITTTKMFFRLLVPIVIISLIFGSVAGFATGLVINPPYWAPEWVHDAHEEIVGITRNAVKESNEIRRVTLQEESAVIFAVEENSPAVVSIIVTKDLPKLERVLESPFGTDSFLDSPLPRFRENGTETREVGGGTGFIVSSDGYVVTNKHVVLDEQANYTVLMNDEITYEATVLARDPVNDIAILKINAEKKLPVVRFGDSDGLRIGQSVITIGNALGEFRNTVSTGIISGLSRSIIAGGRGVPNELLTNVIQTDAAINPGNSGGPLLDLAGNVIGINTAVAGNAENIGFSIPINEVKQLIDNVKENGRLVRPWLGVRYIQVTKELAEANALSVDYGALVLRGNRSIDLAVIPGSPADRAGIDENDIILELDGTRLDLNNPLAKVISRYKPGDKIIAKVLHDGEEKEFEVTLAEFGSD